MFGASIGSGPIRVTFLLIPDFSMIAFTSAIEPLRAANRLAGQDLYRWAAVSADGAPVVASNGIVLNVGGALPEDEDVGVPFVCAGLNPTANLPPDLTGWLRRQGRHGVPLGAVCTGSLILAQAGLLDGYRCTIHWENLPGFREEFPDLDVTSMLFEIDRDRYTCSGGTAPLDMMVNSIALDQGHDLATEVAEQMMHTIIRHPQDPQRMALQHRTGVSNPKVLAAIERMEASLEAPVPLSELARSIALSERQMERLFQKHLGTTPSRRYLDLRLDRARHLLRQTSMPIMQVAVACGFISASHFAKCYRAQFGIAPRNERNGRRPTETVPQHLAE